ncbi:MAG: DUF1152 domain-containing protein [Deltaproteobacteria bacterium]|nr:DUF1152 domain-containing protein [Deltaproteobacteria bacterium]
MSIKKSFKEIIKSSKKALLIGIGGGGDIVGTIPTADLLGMFEVECVFGGLPWERSVFDPVPGPRAFEETKNVRKLNDVVWYANKDSVTSTGVRFAESGFSEVYGQETLLIGINSGPEAIAQGILDAARKLGADLVIGIDVGGDVIAQGNEPGLMSPLADSIMTAAFARLEREITSIIGLFGFGSDGELTPQELESSMKLILQEGGVLGSWGITHGALKKLEEVIAVVPTEASRLPALYAKGKFEETTIRSGTRNVSLSMASTVTFYFSPKILYEIFSKLAKCVYDCKSLEEANDALHSLDIYTELDIERDKLKEK